jgi:DNA polymerase V
MATKCPARQAIERSRKGIGGRPRGAPTAVIRLPLPVAALARRLSQGTLRAGDINGFLDVQPGARMTVPLAGADAKCGFPSPAEDYLDNPLDFNELLVSNPAATFAVHLAGDSMTGAGLFPGDIAVVDRSVAPTNNCIVLALLDGEFTVKRYRRRGNVITLLPENPAFSPIDITEDRAFEIWGVITRSIRML